MPQRDAGTFPAYSLVALLLLAGALGAIICVPGPADAAVITGTTAGTVYLGQTILEESGPVAIIGFGARDPVGGGVLTWVNVTFGDVSGFTTSDLRPLSTDPAQSGVAVFRDHRTSGTNDKLDSFDVGLTPGAIFWGGNTAYMSFGAEALPTFVMGSYEWLVVVRTSDTVSGGDRFLAGIVSDQISFSQGMTQPASTAVTETLTVETVAGVDMIPGGEFMGPQGTAGDTVGALGLRMVDGGAGELLRNVTVTVADSGALDFSWTDLRTVMTLSTLSGIGMYIDNGDVDDVFDPSDQPLDMSSVSSLGNAVTMRFNGYSVPDDPEGDFEFIVVARASGTISDGDDFRLLVQPDGVTFTDVTGAWHDRLQVQGVSSVITADRLPPVIDDAHWEESSPFLHVDSGGTLRFGNSMASTAWATVAGSGHDQTGGSGIGWLEYSTESTLTLPASPRYAPDEWGGAYGFDSLSLDGGSPVTLMLRDAVGNGVQTTLAYDRDTTTPAVNILDPSTPYQTVSGTVKVNATATDLAGMALVEFSTDGTTWTTMTATVGNPSRYSGDWHTQLSGDGAVMLMVRGTDNVGDESVDSVQVVVDNTRVSAAIAAPSSGDYLVGTVDVNVIASSGADRCEFYVDTTLAGIDSTLAGNRFGLSLDTRLFGDASHTLTAKVFNGFGEWATDMIPVFIDNDAPRVSAVKVFYPSGQSALKNGDMVQFRATVTENGSGLDRVVCDISPLTDGTEVDMYDDGLHKDGGYGDGVFGTDPVAVNATWAYHQLMVRASDVAGNRGQGSASVPVDNIDPLITGVYADYPPGQAAAKKSDEVRLIANASESQADVYATLMLDTSGSMSGQKMTDLKAAASAFVGRMSSSDYLSIYVYTNVEDTARLLDFSRMNSTNRQYALDLIDALQATTGTPVWDAIGDSVNYTLMNSSGLPVVIAITDGADDTYFESPPIFEQGSERYCPWHKWGETRFYDEHYGKYLNYSGANHIWVTSSLDGGLGQNRSGLLYAPLPVFTIGLGLEHHDPPDRPVDPVKHTDPNGYVDDVNAYHDGESGTPEYNLWRIGNTSSGGRYFYAPDSDELDSIYESVTDIINKLNAPRGIQAVYADASELGGPLQAAMFDDGFHGDNAAGDGIWGTDLISVESAATEVVSISATAWDYARNDRTIFGTAVLDNTRPVIDEVTAVYAPAKEYADDGDSIHIRARVTDVGAGIATVEVDASLLGGPSAVDMQDDGNGYDLAKGDGTYTSANFTVATGGAIGALTAKVSTADEAGNALAQNAVVDVANDDGKPAVEVVSPGEGAFASGVFTLRVAATDVSGIHNVTARLHRETSRAVVKLAKLSYNEATGYYEGSLPTASLPDGAYEADAVALDTLMNQKTSAKVAFAVDNTAPSLALLSPSEGGVLKGTVTPDIQASDVHLNSTMYRLGSSMWYDSDVDLDTTLYPDGRYTFHVRAIDGAGYEATESVSVIVDNTKPKLKVIAPLPEQVVSGDLSVFLQVTDAGGVSNVTVSLDNDTYPATLDPAGGYYRTTIDLSLYPDGSLEFFAWTYDVAGRMTTAGPFGIFNNHRDRDGDGVPDGEDDFPDDPGESRDTDGDGTGDNADKDDDGDGVPDDEDDFPLDPSESRDTDGDGIGDNADKDDDGDGVPDGFDDLPLDPWEQRDTDGDGTGDNADDDDDGDNVTDDADAFPLNPREWLDTDGDGIGDNADPDDDGDGVPDALDALPKNGAEWLDTDGDGIGDNADPDDDGDGVPDYRDAFPLDPSASVDTDGDGMPDTLKGASATGLVEDGDDDGDGVPDALDAFPLDPDEWLDSDGDGIGDNADDDDDDDGVRDGKDDYPLDPDRWQREEPVNWELWALMAVILVSALIVALSPVLRDRAGRRGRHGEDDGYYDDGWWEPEQVRRTGTGRETSRSGRGRDRPAGRDGRARRPVRDLDGEGRTGRRDPGERLGRDAGGKDRGRGRPAGGRTRAGKAGGKSQKAGIGDDSAGRERRKSGGGRGRRESFEEEETVEWE